MRGEWRLAELDDDADEPARVTGRDPESSVAEQRKRPAVRSTRNVLESGPCLSSGRERRDEDQQEEGAAQGGQRSGTPFAVRLANRRAEGKPSFACFAKLE